MLRLKARGRHLRRLLLARGRVPLRRARDCSTTTWCRSRSTSPMVVLEGMRAPRRMEPHPRVRALEPASRWRGDLRRARSDPRRAPRARAGRRRPHDRGDLHRDPLLEFFVSQHPGRRGPRRRAQDGAAARRGTASRRPRPTRSTPATLLETAGRKISSGDFHGALRHLRAARSLDPGGKETQRRSSRPRSA